MHVSALMLAWVLAAVRPKRKACESERRQRRWPSQVDEDDEETHACADGEEGHRKLATTRAPLHEGSSSDRADDTARRLVCVEEEAGRGQLGAHDESERSRGLRASRTHRCSRRRHSRSTCRRSRRPWRRGSPRGRRCERATRPSQRCRAKCRGPNRRNRRTCTSGRPSRGRRR